MTAFALVVMLKKSVGSGPDDLIEYRYYENF
jgi:hypothetical protein